MQFGNCMYEVNGNLTCKTVEHANNTNSQSEKNLREERKRTQCAPFGTVRCEGGWEEIGKERCSWFNEQKICKRSEELIKKELGVALSTIAVPTTAVPTIDASIRKQGVCNVGYYDKTNGKPNWWQCGENCKGGKYWTDSSCNCACLPLPRGPCNEGYYDKTDGKAKWWACGENCKGGKYWTDDSCNCACLPVP
jgi:hypothetical protein